MAESGEENNCFVRIPELRLTLPQSILEEVGNIDLPVSLVLTIPAEFASSTVGPDRTILGLRFSGLEVGWKVNTVLHSMHILTEKPSNEGSDATFNVSGDISILSDTDSDQTMSQSTSTQAQ